MPKKKQSDSTKARRQRSGTEMIEPAQVEKGHDRPQPELLKDLRRTRTPEAAARCGEVDEETVGHTATKHCILNYPTLYTAGVPELSAPDGHQVWVAPIVLRSPIHGTLGTVGEIHIDARSGEVIDSTPSKQVVAKGRQLYEDKFGADSSAFVQPNER